MHVSLAGETRSDILPSDHWQGQKRRAVMPPKIYTDFVFVPRQFRVNLRSGARSLGGRLDLEERYVSDIVTATRVYLCLIFEV